MEGWKVIGNLEDMLNTILPSLPRAAMTVWTLLHRDRLLAY